MYCRHTCANLVIISALGKAAHACYQCCGACEIQAESKAPSVAYRPDATRTSCAQAHITYVVSEPCSDCYSCSQKAFSPYYNPVGIHQVLSCMYIMRKVSAVSIYPV